jgi:hypothetical protein
LARLTSARMLLLWLVALAVGLAACQKSSSSSVPPTPTASPTTTPSAGPSSTPVPANAGVAFIPDAGRGGPPGITVAHFEEFTGQPFPYKPLYVNFRSSVLFMSIDANNSTALAVLSNGQNYTLLQGILGVSNSSILPGGNPYDTSVPPPSPAPTNAVVPNVTSESMIGTGIDAVGLSIGPDAAGILGVNQASSQTPTYNGFIGFPCKNRTPSVLSGFTTVEASFSIATLSGYYTVLVRGPKDLLAFSVRPNFGVVPPRYTFCYQVEDQSLGSQELATPGTAGRGIMNIIPGDATKAIVGQTSSSMGHVTLVTGLPFAITKSSDLALNGGRVNTVAVAPNGQFAAIGTDEGLFIVGGISGSALEVVGQGPHHSKLPYAPQYKGADGKYHKLQNVNSVGFSTDGLFLTALVSLVPNSPGAAKGGTLVVLPYNAAQGILAAPAVVINDLPLNAYFQDLMSVR